MNLSQSYILISVIALVGIMAVIILARKKMQKPLTPLAGLAFGFIIAGLVFNENRLIGYGLTGVGVMLAIIDIIKKLKAKN